MKSRENRKKSAAHEERTQQKPGQPQNATSQGSGLKSGSFPSDAPSTTEEQPATSTAPDGIGEEPPPEPHDTQSTSRRSVYSSLGPSATGSKHPSIASDTISTKRHPKQALQKHKGPSTLDFSTAHSKASSTTDIQHGSEAMETSNTRDVVTTLTDNQCPSKRLQRRHNGEDGSPTTHTSYSSALSAASRRSTRQRGAQVLRRNDHPLGQPPLDITPRPSQWYKTRGQKLAAATVGSVSRLFGPKSPNNSPTADLRTDVAKRPVNLFPLRSFTLRRNPSGRTSNEDPKNSRQQVRDTTSVVGLAGSPRGSRQSAPRSSARAEPGFAVPVEPEQLLSSLCGSIEEPEVQVSVIRAHLSASSASHTTLSPASSPEPRTPALTPSPARRRTWSPSFRSSKFSTARSEPTSTEEKSIREEMVIESIRKAAEAGRLSAEPVREHTPYITSSDKRGAVVTLLASCAVGIVTYLLVLLKTSLLRTLPEGTRILCDSFDCREHALHIGSTLQSSQLDPCEDFGRFVCASWQPRYILTRTVIEEVAVDWTWKLAAPRARYENAASSSVAEHASIMSSLCVDKSASDQKASTRRLRAFMREQGLLWPDDLSEPLPGNSARPLRSLVDLAVKWRLPLWFDVDLIPSDNARNRAICLTPSRIAVLWDSLFDHVEFADPYAKVLSEEVYWKNIKTSSWVKGAGGAIHRSIIRNLSYAAGPSVATSWISNVTGVANVMQAFSPRDWADALQSAFNASPPITAEDEVVVNDFRDVKVIGRLFREHTPRGVMAHVSWWVAQILGSLTNTAVLKAMQMPDPLEAAFHVIFCGLQIDAAYNMLLAVADKEQVTPQQRTSEEQFLERIFHKTASLVLQSGLIKDDVRTALLATIHGATTIIWPHDQYSNELTRLYSNFTTRAQDGFFDAWKASRQTDSQGFKRQLNSRTRLELAEIRRAMSSSTLISYNTILKTIYVSPAALSPPFYYSAGTSAMIFGGLGFLYARESLRFLASTTPLFLPEAEDIGSNSSLPYGPMDAAPQGSSTCREQGHYLLSDLPALEAAFAAYEMYRSDAEDVRLKDLEKYAPIQVFLITACHAMCETRNATRMSPRCTVAMGNFKPFALAFACPLGSPMNPPEKCDFF